MLAILEANHAGLKIRAGFRRYITRRCSVQPSEMLAALGGVGLSLSLSEILCSQPVIHSIAALA